MSDKMGNDNDAYYHSVIIESDDPLTVQQAVQLAAAAGQKVSEVYIQRLCLEMRLAAQLQHREYRIDRADFMAWLHEPRPRGNPNFRQKSTPVQNPADET